MKKNAEAANFRLLDVRQNIEQDFLKAMSRESRDFCPRERPGHLSFRICWFAVASNDEQVAAWSKKPGDVFGGLRAKGCGQNLERISFENEIKLTAPMRRRFQQVGCAVFDAGTWESLAAGANRSLGNIEGGRAKTPLGELLGIIT